MRRLRELVSNGLYRAAVKIAPDGWPEHLRDDPDLREIYVDRDLTRWTAADLEAITSAVSGAIGGRVGPGRKSNGY